MNIQVGPHVIEKNHPVQSKVALICERLGGIDRFKFVGHFVAWLHFRRVHKIDARTPENAASFDIPITASTIDEFVELPGFTDALVEIGWLDRTQDGLILVSAAARGYYAISQSKKEANREANAPKSSPKKRGKMSPNPTKETLTLASIRRERQTQSD